MFKSLSCILLLVIVDCIVESSYLEAFTDARLRRFQDDSSQVPMKFRRKRDASPLQDDGKNISDEIINSMNFMVHIESNSSDTNELQSLHEELSGIEYYEDEIYTDESMLSPGAVLPKLATLKPQKHDHNRTTINMCCDAGHVFNQNIMECERADNLLPPVFHDEVGKFVKILLIC